MLMWKKFKVGDTQRVFLYRQGRLSKVLEPGEHRVSLLGGDIRTDTYDVSDVLFNAPKIRFLLNTYGDKLDAYLDRFETSDTQVGLFYRENHLVDILPPGTLLVAWKGVEQVRVDVVDISEDCEIREPLLSLLGRGVKVGQSRALAAGILYKEVPDEHVGLLIINGKLVKQLEPGSYGFWKYNRSVVVNTLDMRLQTMEVSGQEILTRDRVSLRINLSASYRIVDVETVALKVNDYSTFVYRELQLRLREAVGTRSLDELLEDKDALNGVVLEAIRQQVRDYGIGIQSVGVKDIILPGDMKLILNKVVEAQKESEANLIKRREETQAMRSLHNTAKLMENNPVLLRLKELEALERVTQRIDRISVYGGLDGVLDNLVRLAPAARAE